MMRALAFLIVALAPGVALAQTVQSGTGRLDLVGTAPSACLVSAPASAVGSNASFAASGTQSAQVTITQLVDQTTSEPRASSISVAVPIICNSAHRVTVRTTNGGLLRQGAQSANPNSVNGFREFLPYQIEAAWSGQDVKSSSATPSPVDIATTDGAAGQLSLTIDVPAGGDPLVAGVYSDSVVIELQVAS
jgi:hypothetical protein